MILREKEMLQRIFTYTDRIYKIVRPKRVFYLAVDGVAPRAKMNQQVDIFQNCRLGVKNTVGVRSTLTDEPRLRMCGTTRQPATPPHQPALAPLSLVERAGTADG